MKRQLPILIVGLLLALAGCTSRNPKLFFGDGQCNLPCWYGLTPNRTTLSEAPEILKSLPIIDRQSVESRSFANPPETDVRWDFTGDTIGYGHLEFDDNSVLERIKIVPNGLNLGDVVDFWGNPSSAWAVYHRDPGGLYYFLTVFYPERGISVEIMGHQLSKKSSTGNEDVTRDMSVTVIDLYDPGRGIEYYFTHIAFAPEAQAQSYIKQLLPWAGFGKGAIHVGSR
ncbi:hypothetical protein GPROT1_02712 [Gammaproteobacteria bacterium]|nr:hypothetical protein GPROT1_02712 [Gammaproteobacteria bacterium]